MDAAHPIVIPAYPAGSDSFSNEHVTPETSGNYLLEPKTSRLSSDGRLASKLESINVHEISGTSLGEFGGSDLPQRIGGRLDWPSWRERRSRAAGGGESGFGVGGSDFAHWEGDFPGVRATPETNSIRGVPADSFRPSELFAAHRTATVVKKL